jgi:hypothetical protein
MHPIDYSDFKKDTFKDTVAALIDSSCFLEYYEQNINSSSDIPNMIPSVCLEAQQN